MTAALRPPLELVGARAREHRTAHFRGASTAVPARAHRLERPSNRRAYANAAVSDAFPGPLSPHSQSSCAPARTSCYLSRRLSQAGPTSSCLGIALTSRRAAQARARGPRRRVATGKADEANQPSVTTGAGALLRHGAPPSQDSCACRRSRRRCTTRTPLRQGRSMPLRALAYFRHRQQHPPTASGPARHAHATCRAATTVLLHPRRPAARAAYFQSMQWRH